MARTRRGITAFLPTLLLVPALAFASAPEAPPDSLGRDLSAWQDTPDWKLLLGAAYSDTLEAPQHTVLLAAVEALQEDDWRVDPPDSSGSAFATGWKPIHNFIFRLFAGHSVARCFATVTSTPDGRTALTFRGAIASKHDLRSSPVKGPALGAYRSAVAGFHRDVRLILLRTEPVAAAR